MILQSQDHLFTMLEGLPSFTAGKLSLAYNDYDGEVLTTPAIVRYNPSEYLTKLSTEPARPHIAVQVRRISDSGMMQDRKRVPFWARTGTTAVKNDAPQMLRVEMQLDVRTPFDVWTSQITTEILRKWYPWTLQTLYAAPLGDAIGDLPFDVRYWFEPSMRNDDVEDEVKARYFRETMLVNVDTWLLPGTSLAEITPTVQTVTARYIDLDTDEDIETQTET